MSRYIAFAGDLHDEQERIDNVLYWLETVEGEVEELWLCGDITTAETLKQFEDYQVNLVFGNADDETISELCKQAERQGATVFPDSGRVVYDGMVFVVRHGLDPRKIAYAVAAHNADYAIHGHYHSSEQTEAGTGKVLSYGLGVLLYDIESDTFEQYDL